MRRKSNDWIGEAIHKPGALHAAAAKAGALTRAGTIRVAWLRQRAKNGDRRAALALTLRRLSHRKRRAR